MPDQNSPVATLDSGNSLSGSEISVYFVRNGERANAISGEVRSYGWSDDEERQFMAALTTISQYVNLTFIETNDRNADFQVVAANLGDRGLLGYFYQPPRSDYSGALMGAFNTGGYGWNTTGGLEAGGLGYSTIIHEALHGLGLDHPHDGSRILNGLNPSLSNFPFGDYGDFGLNQSVYTVMSYNDGWSQNQASDWENDGNAATPMALDIAILQEIYGANTTHNNGDDTYILTDTDDAWVAIWDTGGTDTIRYDGNKDTVIDLREATLQYEIGGGGFISAADGVAGGFTIANGAEVENATGGAGDDILIGNAADNLLNGGFGDDMIKGGTGNDTINGDQDDDTLSGGSGSDTITTTSGTNTIYGGSGFDTLQGGTGADMIHGGSGNDTIDANGGNDAIYGGRGNDQIDGGSGRDVISGGLGADTMTGGAGADTFVFIAVSESIAQNSDTITDFDQGTDKIDFSALDADPTTSGNQTLDMVQSFTGDVGQLRLDVAGGDTTILVDRNGDGVAEMEIFAQGATLTASDFIL
ncbi:M10 family metallopeptidase C-terminal domain-containing protein [Loktanella agnita]|uniref:M10 family metallopeptidase C-terminal domain-containing protein n=1 Tax=Loktanella agnita TaxID=287097 RepID=UPI0039862056